MVPCTGVMQAFPQKLPGGTPRQKCVSLPSVRDSGLQRAPGMQLCSGCQAHDRPCSCIHSFIYWTGFGRLSYQNNEQKVAALRQTALPAPDPPSPPVVVTQDPGSIPGSLLYELISAVSLSQALIITLVELSAPCEVADGPARGRFGRSPIPLSPG